MKIPFLLLLVLFNPKGAIAQDSIVFRKKGDPGKTFSFPTYWPVAIKPHGRMAFPAIIKSHTDSFLVLSVPAPITEQQREELRSLTLSAGDKKDRQMKQWNILYSKEEAIDLSTIRLIKANKFKSKEERKTAVGLSCLGFTIMASSFYLLFSEIKKSESPAYEPKNSFYYTVEGLELAGLAISFSLTKRLRMRDWEVLN